MKKIEFKDNFAFIYLNKNLYSNKVILKSLDIYKDFIDYILFENSTYMTLRLILKNNDYSIEEITNEFCNYLISEQYSIKQ